MTVRNEPNIIEVMQKWSVLIKKLIKLLNKNSIPKDYDGLKKMKSELEAEETRRNEMNRMREAIRKMLRDKKQRERWAKLERRRKIRAFLHLPYKTLNEDEFFKDMDT